MKKEITLSNKIENFIGCLVIQKEQRDKLNELSDIILEYIHKDIDTLIKISNTNRFEDIRDIINQIKLKKPELKIFVERFSDNCFATIENIIESPIGDIIEKIYNELPMQKDSQVELNEYLFSIVIEQELLHSLKINIELVNNEHGFRGKIKFFYSVCINIRESDYEFLKEILDDKEIWRKM